MYSGNGEHDDTDPAWTAALEAFEQLLDVPAPERGASLARLGLGADARRLVERMLAAHDTASLLDEPLPGVPGEQAEPPGLEGRRVGRWLLTSLLGEGGTAVVYRARSLRPPIGQDAAVKLMTMAAATAEGRARFAREIEVLGRLNHPLIAPILDAGVEDDGTPWFAMPRVDGTDIVTWCRARAVPARQRVELLLRVCEAVDHAHRHLVVHRDIKPSNVMVGTGGDPVLLDFGISRVLDSDGSVEPETVVRAFTPRFAAPEQLRGEPVTTATDVFGLGALLRELLKDAPARDRRADLEAVLRRSLAEPSASRYPSVAGFTADLRAWLDGRPVAAREGGPLYRWHRFMVRHALAAGLGAALLISLAAGAIATLWQSREATRHAEQARLTREFLLDVFAEADVLGRGARAPDIGSVLAAAAAEAPRRYAERPELQAEILRLVGRLQRLNMANDAAIRTLRTALALDRERAAAWTDERRAAVRALAVALRLGGQPAAAAAEVQAWMREDPGARRLSSPLHCLGHLDLPYRDLTDRRRGLESVLEPCRAFPAGTRERVLFVSRLATVRRLSGDPAGALELAQAEHAALGALATLPRGTWSEWTGLLAELGQSFAALDRPDDALAATAASVRLAEQNAGAGSPFMVGPLRVHGGRLRDAGRHTEARETLERALAINSALGGNRIRREQGAILLDLGATALASGRPGEAVGFLERALAAYESAGVRASVDLETARRLLDEVRAQLRDRPVT